MATSTISGAPGSTYNGARVFALLLTNGRPNGVASEAVVSSGSFSLTGLVAGTYQVMIKFMAGTSQLTGLASEDVSNVLNQVVVTVDGSSTYNL